MTPPVRPAVLVLSKLALCPELHAAAEVVDATRPADPLPDAATLARVTVMIASSQQPQPADLLAACTSLRLIHCLGAGYEHVDLAEAARRDIAVSNAGGANASSVADHAMALLLGLLRRIPDMDRAARQERWRRTEFLGELAERRVGIVGMGNIGRLIGRRLAGFDTEIFYTARRARPELPYRYCATIDELAGRVDTLILACAETPETHHMLGRDVLRTLGPTGLVVNIGRGGVVDTPALIDALREGVIAGAGLDVVEGEPTIPEELRRMPQVVLSPHVGGATKRSRQRMLEAMLGNLAAVVEGRPPLTPVPGA